MDIQESNNEFVFKHKGDRIKRCFMQTLWILKLNPKQPTFSLFEEWVRTHGPVEEALEKIEKRVKEKGR